MSRRLNNATDLDNRGKHTFGSEEQLWNAFKSGDREAYEQIFSEHYKQLYNFGLKVHRDGEKIVTAGKMGCLVSTKYKVARIPAVEVVLADAVGAGDAFSAAFVYTLLKHDDPFLAGRIGNYVGSLLLAKKDPFPNTRRR